MGSHNLAVLPQGERDAINADLVACRMRRQCSSMGLPAWRQMCTAELAKMPPATAMMIKQALSNRAGRP